MISDPKTVFAKMSDVVEVARCIALVTNPKETSLELCVDPDRRGAWDLGRLHARLMESLDSLGDYCIPETVQPVEPRFPVGATFRHRKSRDSDWLIYTVEDYHVTRNLAGEAVKARYLVSHSFLGSLVTDSDFLEVTIARAMEDKANGTGCYSKAASM